MHNETNMPVFSTRITFIRNSLFLLVATFLTVNLLQLAERSPASYVSSLNIVHAKKILLWNPFFNLRDYDFGEGSRDLFQRRGCRVTNCFITFDRTLLPEREYDAVVFHGAEYQFLADKPRERFDNQLYVYFSMESPANRPASSSLNDFFNITMTHRLDSDVFNGYFYILNTAGEIIAPAKNPDWIKPVFDENIIEKYKLIHKKKTKFAAWFVSNCHSTNGREDYVKQLRKFIQIDIYGECGNLTCPRTEPDVCFKLLENDYFFYLSFENSDCVDYITEKAVYPLEHDVIPVIYGGANATKFLPPNSYIDASIMTPEKLAQTLKSVAGNPELYAKYFWWKNYYKADQFAKSSFCDLCKYLNDEPVPKKIYKIVDWWHGNSSHPICKNRIT